MADVNAVSQVQSPQVQGPPRKPPTDAEIAAHVKAKNPTFTGVQVQAKVAEIKAKHAGNQEKNNGQQPSIFSSQPTGTPATATATTGNKLNLAA